MALIPKDAPESAARSFSSDNVFPSPEAPVRQKIWPKRLLSVCFAIFAFAIGLFLAIFPWMHVWNLNYVQGLIPAFRNIWGGFYVRAAVTGLGLVNLYVAGFEIARLLKRY